MIQPSKIVQIETDESRCNSLKGYLKQRLRVKFNLIFKFELLAESIPKSKWNTKKVIKGRNSISFFQFELCDAKTTLPKNVFQL